MKRVLLSILMVLPMLASAGGFTQYVNPFVGTDFHGHTFPGAAYPFGMVQLSPDTRPMPGNWDGCSGYHYSDEYIYGLSHTHLSGTGCDDLCDIMIMPVRDWTGPLDREKYKSAFSHGREKAEAGYYEVWLEDPQVEARLTVGRRSGWHLYTFPKGAVKEFVIDLKHRDYVTDSQIRMLNPTTVVGHRQSRSWATSQDVYFWMEFSAPLASYEAYGDEGALLRFDGQEQDILVRVGISSVSEDNARMNLRADSPAGDGRRLSPAAEFGLVRSAADAAWEGYLSKIAVAGGSDGQLRTFYTALYHTAIHPSLYSDVNGEYRGMDREVHMAVGFERYDIFSLWDTFRALHPLFTIIERDRTADFLKSFQSIYNECGKLPIWELAGNETNCMIGYNSVSVIADAMAKGIGGVDYRKLLHAMLDSSRKHEYGLDSFYGDGAVLVDKEHESVSKTLEYAYDAWCVSEVARRLGDDAHAAEYAGYAQHWLNIFDPSTGFMRPRLNGRWLTPFHPTEVNNHFTEANSWQYSFFVPQDVAGHMAALGGEAAYVAKIDALFDAAEQTTGRTQADITGQIGQYAHGNEPSHHIPYLYNYAGQPWKTQMRVRQIMSTLYSDAPDGLCGNEDCGQMSAWYVLSALGFYNVCPGQNELCLTSPLFREAVIQMDHGASFTITASSTDTYIQSARLNGEPYGKSWIDAEALLDGGRLDFVLGGSPSQYGAASQERPHSAMARTLVRIPSFVMDADKFHDSQAVALTDIPQGAKAYYRVFPAGEAAKGEFKVYNSPLTVTESSTVQAYTALDGVRSATASTTVYKIFNDRKIELHSRYNPQYSAGGDDGIIDGLRGATNWKAGGWQGYQGEPFEAVVELLEPRSVSAVGAGFCQDARSWIWMPRCVDFYVSMDKSDWHHLGRVDNDVDPQDYEIQIKDMKLALDKPQTVKYIKVVATQFGTIPEWHPGAGGESFIFVDEILID